VQESLAPGEASRWGTAVGNIEDARVALDTLARAIEDAVYLDEDDYNQVAPVMQFQRTIQVLRWKSAEPCLPPARKAVPRKQHSAGTATTDYRTYCGASGNQQQAS